jgi:hypothetical protein
MTEKRAGWGGVGWGGAEGPWGGGARTEKRDRVRERDREERERERERTKVGERPGGKR